MSPARANRIVQCTLLLQLCFGLNKLLHFEEKWRPGERRELTRWINWNEETGRNGLISSERDGSQPESEEQLGLQRKADQFDPNTLVKL
jgi:hypothetical protein